MSNLFLLMVYIYTAAPARLPIFLSVLPPKAEAKRGVYSQKNRHAHITGINYLMIYSRWSASLRRRLAAGSALALLVALALALASVHGHTSLSHSKTAAVGSCVASFWSAHHSRRKDCKLSVFLACDILTAMTLTRFSVAMYTPTVQNRMNKNRILI